MLTFIVTSAMPYNLKLFIIRLLGATWCLGCFVLATAYSSVLLSFLLAPDTYKPIINSINELPFKRDIQPTVTKDLVADVIFKVYKFNHFPSPIRFEMNIGFNIDVRLLLATTKLLAFSSTSAKS